MSNLILYWMAGQEASGSARPLPWSGPAEQGGLPGLVPVIFENLTIFTSFKIGVA